MKFSQLSAALKKKALSEAALYLKTEHVLAQSMGATEQMGAPEVTAMTAEELVEQTVYLENPPPTRKVLIPYLKDLNLKVATAELKALEALHTADDDETPNGDASSDR